MIQKTFTFRSLEEFRAQVHGTKTDSAYQSARHGILQVALQGGGRELMRGIQDAVNEELPGMLLMGMTADAVLARPDASSTGSFCFFDEAEFSVAEFDFDLTGEQEAGKQLYGRIKALPYVRGVLIFSSGHDRNISQFIDCAVDSNNNLPLFGINAGAPSGGGGETVFSNGAILPRGAVAVILRGRNLHVRAISCFGWQPLGKELEISATDGPLCVTAIDDMPATYIYELYLHVKPDENFMGNVAEFPLLLTERYGTMQARIPVRYDAAGHLYFGADMRRGEKIRLTYGNIRHILSESRVNSNLLHRFGAQALFLYACGNRGVFLKQAAQKELSYFRNVNPSVFHCCGWGEIMRLHTGGLLNAALVAVAMHEGTVTPPQSDLNPPEQLEPTKLTMPLSSRLISFLETTNKEMKESNEAKSNFLSNMSHEIRTPINAVLGLDEMILRECADPVIKSYALDIQRSGKMLLSLINDILDFSKIEANKLEILPSDYDLSGTVTDLMNMALPSAQQKRLDLVVDIAPDIPHQLRGDEQRLKQCILNILTNAVKYTQVGTITLSMGAVPAEGNAIMLTVRVVDTGIGIKKEDLRKLFTPFERIEESRNRSIEGTGLGMSIVKGLLAKMDSCLIVKSEYGHGSDFSFTVRQEVRDPEPIGNWHETQLRIAGKAARYQESFQAPGARILVVDDMATNLTVICGLLKSTRVQIRTADNAMSALHLAREEKYDLLLIDHLMPGMDGVQLLHELRKDKTARSRDSVCIALTANAIVGAKEKYLAEGFESYLSKPVEGKLLEAALRTYLPKELIILPGEEGFEEAAPAPEPPSPDRHAGNGEAAELFSQAFSLDIGAALTNCGDKEVFLQAVETFRAGITERAGLVERLAAEGSFRDYTIQVHGIKGSARLIGATGLSDRAAELERLGDQAAGTAQGADARAAAERIRAETPGFLAAYRRYLGILLPLCPQEREDTRAEMPPAQLAEARTALREFVSAFDFPGAAAVVEAMDGFRMPADFAESFARIKELVQVGDQAALLALL